jgi:hypothetical protein
MSLSMRIQIAELKRSVGLAILLAGTTMFVSCASQRDQVRLVDDPDDHHESALPWNKQEKWELEAGQFANMVNHP